MIGIVLDVGYINRNKVLFLFLWKGNIKETFMERGREVFNLVCGGRSLLFIG